MAYKYNNSNKNEKKTNPLLNKNNESKSNEDKIEKIKNNNIIDEVYGFKKFEGPSKRIGWLINMKAGDMVDEESVIVSAMDYFFLEEDGSRFKATIKFNPYFYLATKKGSEFEVCAYLQKKYADSILQPEILEKEDLDLENHLSGLRRTYIKISSHSMDELLKIRRELEPRIKSNKRREDGTTLYDSLMAQHLGESGSKSQFIYDPLDKIIDIREFDVPYLVRTAIDLEIFVGLWYEISGNHWNTVIAPKPEIVDRPEPVVFAYDIETTKLPLKFPDSTFDQIMMISYMVDGRGYLICNRELISADIDDFEFTPRPEFPGPFSVFNEPDEVQTLTRFFQHIRELRPNIIATYNGDSFDWPFVEARAAAHNLNMSTIVGFERDSQGEYKSRCALHMDCYKWVQRDSYLPVGSQGLKAVCKAKLRYDPVEVDPEEMCTLAREQPRTLANYSVSDAVATYYLYMQYVHPFIFALCTIIPLEPDEVLRKGSGTLCEALLMVQAHKANIIFPNKQQQKFNELTAAGNLLESETYVGGHVEAIESGVFRSDIATKFRLVPEMCQSLRDNLRETLTHGLVVEEKIDLSTVIDFESVMGDVDNRLQSLQQTPHRLECPVIYHLDVAAMYPNIILSNRLQPSAIVTETSACSKCDHNGPNAKCKRPMEWMWRAEVFTNDKSDFNRIQSQLEQEQFPGKKPGDPKRPFYSLSKEEQSTLEKDRLKAYCKKAYPKAKVTKIEERTSTVCQKENSFYVDTVRSFRDRRYEFKDLTKSWKRTLDGLVARGSGSDPVETKRARGMLVLYDSLQLAHKCILNSFYGYVMRRGARWYSMEMAGIVCNTGANIIKNAREIIEQIGRPLELDTDGIWCMLPSSFPENVTFRTSDKKRPTVTVSYPGVMLNVMVQALFTNHQYHELVDGATRTYKMRSENSIFFEVDGPYKAMILPASKEQGKKLKKRYAVFNLDNSLAELKGFEVKRNGELNLIKIFQSSVFEAFLKGSTLEEVYASVASVADRWLDLLYSQGANISDAELLELISEKRCMSKKLLDYGAQKSTSISTAKRLAEFLGDEMVKDAGLSFHFIISRKPDGLQVTDRAIPLAIFHADQSVKRHYLRKWLKMPDLEDEDIDLRSILDWQYYIDRFNSNIQKIITIPAALQHIANPVPRVPHPDWLHKKVLEKEDTFKQRKIDDMFAVLPEKPPQPSWDIENAANKAPKVSIQRRKRAHEPDNDDRELPESIVMPPRSQTRQWLAYHIRKWTLQRQRKSEEHKQPPQKLRRPMTTVSTTKEISSFFDRSNQSVLQDTWQIIEIRESTIAGQYRMWVLIGSKMHCMELTVPRTFYVNTRVAKETTDTNDADGNSNVYFKKVHNKILPRSHIVHHLYEYNIGETVFIDHGADIRAEFVRNEVEGVYELGVPLLFRAFARLGCLCTVFKASNDRTSAMVKRDLTKWRLDDLRFRSVKQHPYLEEGSLETVLIYQHKSGPNQVMAVFLQGRGHIVLVDPRGKAHSGTRAEYARLSGDLTSYYRSQQRQRGDNEDKTKLEVIGEPSEEDAFKAINSILEGNKTRSLVVVMTNKSLATVITSLNANPSMTMPIPTDTSFNAAFNWQQAALRSALHGFLEYRTLLEQQLDRARYLHVPICNLPMFTEGQQLWSSCDLFFARYLLKSDHVLWCSQGNEPDLGGKETVDRRQMLLLNSTDHSDTIIQYNRSGSYQSICIELDLTYIVINALVAMEKIDEIDGTNSRLFDSSVRSSNKTIDQMLPRRQQNLNMNLVNQSISTYDDTVAASPSFKILRRLFLDWIADVRQYKNVVADEHIVNLHRWLRTSTSLLYDPALYKTLHRSMRTLFFKLVEQMTNLGLEVVFGSLNRMIVCTRRTDLLEALLHVEYATKVVKSQDVFAVIDFRYVAGWEYLLWRESGNYGGVKVDLSGLRDTEAEAVSFVDWSSAEHCSEVFSAELRDPSRLDLSWHLQRYLAPDDGMQARFVAILSEFMFSVLAVVKEEYKLARLEQGQGQVQAPALGHDASIYPATVEKLDEVMDLKISKRLYSLATDARDLDKYFKRVAINGDKRFPPLLPLKSAFSECPILDLVNTICHILSLDKTAASYTGTWKRNMLKTLDYNEFHKGAIWKSPYSRSTTLGREVPCNGELLVVIPELICDHCNLVRDLDFCRDKNCHLINESWCFLCPGCERPYNKDAMETALVDQLNSLSELALLQDLQCSRCPQGIIETVLAGTRNCVRCGQSLTCTRSASLLEQQVSVYADLGKCYGMDHLASVASWMLGATRSSV